MPKRFLAFLLVVAMILGLTGCQDDTRTDGPVVTATSKPTATPTLTATPVPTAMPIPPPHQ